MVCTQVAVLPQLSVAVYVLLMVNLLAQTILTTASELVRVTVPPQLSLVGRFVAGGGTLLAQLTVILAGHVIDGGMLSKTVMVCAQVAELPHSSVAL